MPVPTRQIETTLVQHAHDRGDGAKLQKQVENEVEPVLNGQTAAKSFKPAILDNGIRVMVPPFIGQDEAIVVNTELFEYSERA